MEQEQESRLNFFMSLPYLYVLSRETDPEDNEVYYKLTYPDLPGLTIYNDTVSAVMAERDDAREVWLMANLDAHEVIPLPRQLIKEKKGGGRN